MAKSPTPLWDLYGLLDAAHPEASIAERHLWIIRLVEWLRHGPAEVDAPADVTAPVMRLRALLSLVERDPVASSRVAFLLAVFIREVDSPALLADFGFAPRTGLWGEFARRLNIRWLPSTPATTDLGELFAMVFPQGADVAWLRSIDDATLARLGDFLASANISVTREWQIPFFDAVTFLASAIRGAGFTAPLRRRMDEELLAHQPFHQLARVAERLREYGQSTHPEDRIRFVHEAQYLRAVLETCRRCAASVNDHLEEHGVSVDVVFEIDQLRRRSHRIDSLLTCVLTPTPGRELTNLVAELARIAGERQSIKTLFAKHYSLLARKVAERSAARGEHYITRSAGEYWAMLRAAVGGGAVLGATTLMKFALLTVGLGAFWGGAAAGLNYAVSFVVIQFLHFTVATKQPAMTAPAMADKLVDVSNDAAIEVFVDEIANLLRSQVASILGNVLAVIPIVLLAQWASRAAFGAPLVSTREAEYVLSSLSLLGATPLFAAFTGVLLFASSIVAGWVENWFVWHRLDSAIEWNPRIVARLGAPRARRWSIYMRSNISGLASNVSLGLMLGLLPPLLGFLSLPLDVRHVTLASGQLAAALGALGPSVVNTAPFWWCVAGIAVTGVLNLGVSFFLAFRLALLSRGIAFADRNRIGRVIRARLLRQPMSFLLPPRVRAARGVPAGH